MGGIDGLGPTNSEGWVGMVGVGVGLGAMPFPTSLVMLPLRREVGAV